MGKGGLAAVRRMSSRPERLADRRRLWPCDLAVGRRRQHHPS
jgi:hypothetical protein